MDRDLTLTRKRAGVVFLLCCLISCSTDASPSWRKKLQECSQGNRFACLIVEEGPTSEGQAVKEAMQKIIKEQPGKIEIIETDFGRQKADIEKYFKVKLKDTPPFVFMVAPNGALTGMFTKTIDEKKVRQTLVSPEEADLIFSLQNGKVVFLCFYNRQSDELKRVKSELNAIDKFFKGKATAQYLNTDEVAELAFVKRLPAFNHDSVTVFSVVPPGRIKNKLEGVQIKRANLLKAFQSCCPTGKNKNDKPCK